jgi:polysaccharide pyruvyl transferase WcaK-like protein
MIVAVYQYLWRLRSRNSQYADNFPTSGKPKLGANEGCDTKETMRRRDSLKLFAAAPLSLAAQGQRPKRILLISGWNTKNIGDVAHTPGFLRVVEKHLPGTEVTVAVANQGLFEETRRYLNERWPKMRVVMRPFAAPQRAVTPEYKAAFDAADLVVVNSGMTMSYGYYGLEWDRYMGNILALEMARSAGKPYGVFGHSFDRMDSPAEAIMVGLLSNAAFVYTRDGESLKLIQSKGVRCPVMDFGPDAAFGFDLRDEAKARVYMKANELEPRKFLAFIPRVDITRFANDGREKVLAEKHREILTRWVRTTGMPVAMVAEVEGQIEPARTMVYEPLPDDVKAKVRFRREFWWPDEAASVYKEATAVVSLEMHSVIMGLQAGTPSVHPYFQQAGLKQWMMRDIGRPEWLFDIDTSDLSPLSNELARIAKDQEGARRRTAEAMRFVERRQGEMATAMGRAMA